MSVKLRQGTGPFKNNVGEGGETVGTLVVSPGGNIGNLTYNDGSQLGLGWDFGEPYGGYLFGGNNPGPHPWTRLVFECLQANTDGLCIKWYWHEEREQSDGHGGYNWVGVANQNGTFGPIS